ncbi:ParB N-terminal domain-containing protein [Paraburkholderia phymatum]|uniref:ParB N-terminal domain-containing protein n=1 Tax=Paraburkholderia phymatum TaxID=148447 RepID=UPI00316E5E61
MTKALSDKARKPHEWTEIDLQNLQIEWKNPDFVEFSIPLKKLLVCPQVFQVRDLHTKSKNGVTNNDHVMKLAERLDKEGELDRVDVLPISANRFVVIDGTHRRAAYARRLREQIPVRVWTGTLSQARVAAGRKENSKKKLEWTHQEKSQYLYQLILVRPVHDATGKQWTHEECAEASDRSPRLARSMERFIRRCKDEGTPVPEKWSGGAWARDEEEHESAEERLARQFVEKMLAAFGPLSSRAKARAFGIAVGRYTEQAEEVARALVEDRGLQEALVGDIDEMIAERAEEHLEIFQTHAAERQYLSAMFAAVGAGF